MGRGKPGKKTSFGKMEGNLSEQRQGWARNFEVCSTSIEPSLENEIGDLQ